MILTDEQLHERCLDLTREDAAKKVGEKKMPPHSLRAVHSHGDLTSVGYGYHGYSGDGITEKPPIVRPRKDKDSKLELKERPKSAGFDNNMEVYVSRPSLRKCRSFRDARSHSYDEEIKSGKPPPSPHSFIRSPSILKRMFSRQKSVDKEQGSPKKLTVDSTPIRIMRMDSIDQDSPPIVPLEHHHLLRRKQLVAPLSAPSTPTRKQAQHYGPPLARFSSDEDIASTPNKKELRRSRTCGNKINKSISPELEEQISHILLHPPKWRTGDEEQTDQSVIPSTPPRRPAVGKPPVSPKYRNSTSGDECLSQKPRRVEYGGKPRHHTVDTAQLARKNSRGNEDVFRTEPTKNDKPSSPSSQTGSASPSDHAVADLSSSPQKATRRRSAVQSHDVERQPVAIRGKMDSVDSGIQQDLGGQSSNESLKVSLGHQKICFLLQSIITVNSQ